MAPPLLRWPILACVLAHGDDAANSFTGKFVLFGGVDLVQPVHTEAYLVTTSDGCTVLSQGPDFSVPSVLQQNLTWSFTATLSISQMYADGWHEMAAAASSDAYGLSSRSLHVTTVAFVKSGIEYLTCCPDEWGVNAGLSGIVGFKITIDYADESNALDDAEVDAGKNGLEGYFDSLTGVDVGEITDLGLSTQGSDVTSETIGVGLTEDARNQLIAAFSSGDDSAGIIGLIRQFIADTINNQLLSRSITLRITAGRVVITGVRFTGGSVSGRRLSSTDIDYSVSWQPGETAPTYSTDDVFSSVNSLLYNEGYEYEEDPCGTPSSELSDDNVIGSSCDGRSSVFPGESCTLLCVPNMYPNSTVTCANGGYVNTESGNTDLVICQVDECAYEPQWPYSSPVSMSCSLGAYVEGEVRHCNVTCADDYTGDAKYECQGYGPESDWQLQTQESDSGNWAEYTETTSPCVGPPCNATRFLNNNESDADIDLSTCDALEDSQTCTACDDNDRQCVTCPAGKLFSGDVVCTDGQYVVNGSCDDDDSMDWLLIVGIIILSVVGLCCIFVLVCVYLKYAAPKSGYDEVRDSHGQMQKTPWTVSVEAPPDQPGAETPPGGKKHITWNLAFAQVEDFKQEFGGNKGPEGDHDALADQIGEDDVPIDIGTLAVMSELQSKPQALTATAIMDNEEQHFKPMPESCYARFNQGEFVEYYSKTHRTWMSASVRVVQKPGTAARPEAQYNVNVLGAAKQARLNASPDILRLPLKRAEFCWVFKEDFDDWFPGTVSAKNPSSSRFGYSVLMEGGEMLHNLSASLLKRRYVKDSHIEVFTNETLGWTRAQVVLEKSGRAEEVQSTANPLVEFADLAATQTTKNTPRSRHDSSAPLHKDGKAIEFFDMLLVVLESDGAKQVEIDASITRTLDTTLKENETQLVEQLQLGAYSAV